MLFNRREHKILNALLKNEDRTWIIVNFNSSSEELERIEEKFEQAMEKPGMTPTFQLDSSNCDILYNGKDISYCAQLHREYPSNSNWLQIEDSCLLCLVYHNQVEETSVEAMCSNPDIVEYFGRTPLAIHQRIYILLRNERKPLYLPEEIWEDLKK